MSTREVGIPNWRRNKNVPVVVVIFVMLVFACFPPLQGCLNSGWSLTAPTHGYYCGRCRRTRRVEPGVDDTTPDHVESANLSLSREVHPRDRSLEREPTLSCRIKKGINAHPALLNVRRNSVLRIPVQRCTLRKLWQNQSKSKVITCTLFSHLSCHHLAKVRPSCCRCEKQCQNRELTKPLSSRACRRIRFILLSVVPSERWFCTHCPNFAPSADS
jgi:hypothetical protein